MSWDLTGGNSDKTNFTKFPAGVTRIRVLSTAPHQRWTHWLQAYSRSVTCPGMKVCPIDKIRAAEKKADLEYTYPVSGKFAMNIYNQETEQLEVMEQGVEFMEDLKAVMLDLRDEGKSLSDAILKVRRTGLDKNTKYRIDIDSITPLTPVEEEAQLQMKDLVTYFKPHTPEQIQALIDFVPTADFTYADKWNEVNEFNKEEDDESITVGE